MDAIGIAPRRLPEHRWQSDPRPAGEDGAAAHGRRDTVRQCQQQSGSRIGMQHPCDDQDMLLEQFRQVAMPEVPAPTLQRPGRYSHSIVAGGLLEMSYTTRLTPLTSLIIRVEIRASNSWGKWLQSAVMKSSVLTERTATVNS